MKINYPTLIAYMALVIVLTFGIIYTNTVDRRTEHKFCAILDQLSHVYEQNPPTTDTAKKFAIQYEDLRQQLGCL